MLKLAGLDFKDTRLSSDSENILKQLATGEKEELYMVLKEKRDKRNSVLVPIIIIGRHKGPKMNIRLPTSDFGYSNSKYPISDFGSRILNFSYSDFRLGSRIFESWTSDFRLGCRIFGFSISDYRLPTQFPTFNLRVPSLFFSDI